MSARCHLRDVHLGRDFGKLVVKVGESAMTTVTKDGTQKALEVDGRTLAYRDVGSGPPVVLVHSGGFSARACGTGEAGTEEESDAVSGPAWVAAQDIRAGR